MRNLGVLVQVFCNQAWIMPVFSTRKHSFRWESTERWRGGQTETNVLTSSGTMHSVFRMLCYIVRTSF